MSSQEIQLKIRPGQPEGIRKLQVGCGPHNLLSDWWNVDLRDFKGIDEVLDATQPWPFTSCLDYIYAEHFLEHLSFSKAVLFLKNARKSLSDTGRIRLSTPSLEWVLKTHFTFKSEKDDIINQTWAINRAFHGWGHQFLYSREVLVELLKATGYENIQLFEYGVSDTYEFTNIERHGGYRVVDGYPSVWIVEATNGHSVPNTKILDEGEEKFSRYVASGH